MSGDAPRCKKCGCSKWQSDDYLDGILKRNPNWYCPNGCDDKSHKEPAHDHD